MSKVKVMEKPEIVVHGTVDKPYFEIRYREVGKDHCNIGYSSYDLKNCFQWLEEEFEVVKTPTAEEVLAKASFEDKMSFCSCCEHYMTCAHLHDSSCKTMIAKVETILVEGRARAEVKR